MNELCRFYGQHLPLYAEGELGDEYLCERIEAHVLCCTECRAWVEDYEELTRSILESDLDALEADRESSTARIEHIMAAVHGSDRRRRGMRHARAAGVAAGIAAAVVGLATLAATWFPTVTEPATTELARGERIDFRASPALSSRESLRTLAENLWVLVDDRAGGEHDARLFGVVERDRARPGVAPRVIGARASDGWLVDVRMNEGFRDPEAGGWIYLVPAAPGSRELRAIPVRRSRLRPYPARDALERGGVAGDDSRLYRFVLVPDSTPKAEHFPVVELDHSPAIPSIPGPNIQDAIQPSRVLEHLEIVR